MAEYNGAELIPADGHDTYPAVDPKHADLGGKVVLVTGASKGIGRAIALAVAQAGASGLVLLARSNLDVVKQQCLAAQGPGRPLEVLTLAADITDTDQVAAAAAHVETTFGRVDVVVNNAGYLERCGRIADSDPEEWWSVWNTNVRGTYGVTRAFLPLLIRCGGDRTIVNVSSTGAHTFSPRYSAYSTSKLALLRFTEFVNVEYGAQGVLAYSVHPGSVESDMSLSMPEDILAQGVLVDTPELAAHTIVWLVRERRDWLAGRFVDARWDVEALVAKRQEIVGGDKLKVRMVV
ncbi:uncharacterized protein PHACADRAFT_211397 [Phanerochaete carnosa HHB-10118-sp]|uniref:Ketoreductase domain-containing protein n=1 Tax=Phanerochaete carnosa (strain HHB-10118-sp) TaxID=650164 RepID=K5W459_PHACS|nr:uncharacterized protein PHACADRAFT_211397 [Phanerochaete carnosa HHB-10118-sp]EKM53734.1 hypothetical protein PHACADRAFT_211397 [Phanerochaete carnosa HHB-10118-sp]